MGVTKIRDEDERIICLVCPCGGEIHDPEGWENECHDCGALYNGSGQRLRDNWERTCDEPWDDC